MEGGEAPRDWAALAPHIEHPTRKSIVEALRWIGPLSAPELKRVLDDRHFHLAGIAYHLRTLVGEEVLVETGARAAGVSIEKVYFLAGSA